MLVSLDCATVKGAHVTAVVCVKESECLIFPFCLILMNEY